MMMRATIRKRVASRPLQALAAFQGAYYLVSGIWPLVSIKSFQAVTGPKRDVWLVKTVGTLISIVGVSLISSARSKHRSDPSAALGFGSAIALAAIDANYSLKGTISRIYLLDAIAEILLAATWIIAYTRDDHTRR